MNDKISELIISIKNASRVGKKTTTVPASKLKKAILVLLKKEGYITDYEEVGDKPKTSFVITLAYRTNGEPRISEIKRSSKLSRRLYTGYRGIRPVRYGHGSMIISTPLGIMTEKEAKSKKLGGETLFSIW